MNTFQTVKDFYLLVAEGKVSDWVAVNVIGRNLDVDIAAPEDVIGIGGLYQFPGIATVITAVSDDPSDHNGAGSPGGGAAIIRYHGLDEDFKEQTEDIELDGTTPVLGTKTFIRVNRSEVIDGGNNNGNITGTVDGKTVTKISVGDNNSLDAIFTIPAQREGYAVQGLLGINRTVGASGSRDADFNLKFREFGGLFKTSAPIPVTGNGSANVPIPLTLPLMFKEKTDIRIEVAAAADDTDVSAIISILLKDITP